MGGQKQTKGAHCMIRRLHSMPSSPVGQVEAALSAVFKAANAGTSSDKTFQKRHDSRISERQPPRAQKSKKLLLPFARMLRAGILGEV